MINILKWNEILRHEMMRLDDREFWSDLKRSFYMEPSCSDRLKWWLDNATEDKKRELLTRMMDAKKECRLTEK